MALTAKQSAFVACYVKCFNATQAAIEAGYSEKTAYSQGARLLKKVEISAEIERFLAEHAMSAGEVLYHLTMIARGDFEDVSDVHGNLDKSKARQRGKTNLIKKVKTRSITTEDSDLHEGELEMYDRLKALELLAKYHDLINKVRVEDWRTQAIADIRAGNITYEALADGFDESLAAELFTAAGVPVQVGESATGERD